MKGQYYLRTQLILLLLSFIWCYEKSCDLLFSDNACMSNSQLLQMCADSLNENAYLIFKESLLWSIL